MSKYEYRLNDGDLSGIDAKPAGSTLEEALRDALARLKRGHTRTVSVLRFLPPGEGERRTAQTPQARVELYCLRPGLVLPVGLGDLAENVHDLLLEGFDGWHSPTLPADPEPLTAKEGLLPIQVWNLLYRRSFRYVEQVALIPDDGLLEMRGMGTTYLTKLRELIPGPRPHHVATRHQAEPVRSEESASVVATESKAEMITIRASSDAAVFAEASRWLAQHPKHGLFAVNYDYSPTDLDGEAEPYACVLRLTALRE